ncbi:MAG: 23S rRNA (adenine(2503)-C(2))-methyltransferase RlmN [Eubacterium sp.]|nr:23S rRNA (adenine(2503)-C(2))-methyltransferase RlmN [Eubacterium sp.]
MEKTDILSMNPEELTEFIREIGEANFRGKQIFTWLHNKKVCSFDDMTNLSVKLRGILKEKAGIYGVKTIKKYKSSEDNTIKYLFQIENGYIIESVLMKYEYGYTVCVSTQAGCRMGCSFCASTIGGLERSLTAGEILSQIYEIERQEGVRVGHVVMMGCGEPLDNFENCIKFISIISHKEGAGISRRNITLSTCGLTDKIYELAEYKLPITLAVSLHAPNDEIRKRLMPVANKYKYEEVIKAARDYAEITKRRVTFEYSLIDGINDSKENAEELSKRLRGILAHVNLIPVNSVKERNYNRSSDKNVRAFSRILTERGIENTVRRRLGADINAACGQLRKSMKNSK